MKRVFVFTTLVIISLLLYGCTAAMKSMVSEGMALSMDYKFAEAIPYLEEEIRSDPSATLAQARRINLGSAYCSVGQPQKALSLMQEALTTYKSQGLEYQCYSVIGRAYWAMREYNKAIKIYEKSLQFKESAVPHANLASIYMELGKFDLAIEHGKIAFKMDNKLPDKSFKSISAMQEAGNLELALRFWKLYLAESNLMPLYIEDEEVLSQLLEPKRVQHIEQQIEILTRKLEPQTFEESKQEDKFGSYAEKVAESLVQSARRWRIVVGDFGTRTVERTKLGAMLAAAITEKLNAEEQITVLQGDDVEGTILYGVIEDVGPIVIVRVHLQSPDGSLAIASPEPLTIAKNPEVAELLQASN